MQAPVLVRNRSNLQIAMNDCVLTSSLREYEAQYAVVDGGVTKLPLSHYFNDNIWLILVFVSSQTPHVNRTDIIALNERQLECNAFSCQIIVVSLEQHYSILAMLNGAYPSHLGGIDKHIKIPVISDNNRKLTSIFPSQRADTRSLYLIDPKGVVRHSSISCDSIGIGVEESVRLLKAFQFTDLHGEVCPINWTPGNKTIVPNVNDSKEYFASSTPSNAASENISRISYSLYKAPPTLSLFEKISRYISVIKQTSYNSIERCAAAYDNQLITNPLRTKVITASALAIAGEIITSAVNVNNPVSTWLSEVLALPIAEGNRTNDITVQKVVLAGIYGGISGAVYHYWFQLLAQLMEYNKNPHLAKYIPLLQLVVDQLVMTPVFTLFTMAFMEFNRDNSSSVWSRIKRHYSVSLIVTWKKYLVLQGVNFFLLPQHRQVLFGDLTRLFWKIFFFNVELSQ